MLPFLAGLIIGEASQRSRAQRRRRVVSVHKPARTSSRRATGQVRIRSLPRPGFPARFGTAIASVRISFAESQLALSSDRPAKPGTPCSRQDVARRYRAVRPDSCPGRSGRLAAGTRSGTCGRGRRAGPVLRGRRLVRHAVPLAQRRGIPRHVNTVSQFRRRAEAFSSWSLCWVNSDAHSMRPIHPRRCLGHLASGQAVAVRWRWRSRCWGEL